MKQIFVTIKKWWWVPLLASLSIAATIFAIKKLKKKPQTDEVNANEVMDNLDVPDRKKPDLNKVAVQVAHHLGTAYSWYDPRRWTENDWQAYEQLKGLSQADFDIVKELYFKVYAKGRTLYSDLVALLDKQYLNRLTVR